MIDDKYYVVRIGDVSNRLVVDGKVFIGNQCEAYMEREKINRSCGGIRYILARMDEYHELWDNAPPSEPYPAWLLCKSHILDQRKPSEHCDLIVIKNAFDSHEKWADVSNLIEKDGWTYFVADGNSYVIKGEVVIKKNSRMV